jgi:hypothetical protein
MMLKPCFLSVSEHTDSRKKKFVNRKSGPCLLKQKRIKSNKNKNLKFSAQCILQFLDFSFVCTTVSLLVHQYNFEL